MSAARIFRDAAAGFPAFLFRRVEVAQISALGGG